MRNKIDLKNQRFNRLLVIEEIGRNKYNQIMWKCLCNCGNKIIVSSNSLRCNNTQSCGCLQKEIVGKRSKIDLIGQRFERLLVIEEVGRNKYKRVLWKCLCDCGNEKIINGNNLRRGTTKSCGCLRKERVSETHKGKIVSEATRKKLSEAQRGKILSEEHKKKISKRNSGESHPNWNPKLTDEERQDTRKYSEYVEWRESVYERDNYTCQVCGDNKSDNLIAHHLDGYDNYPELRTELSNGVTMCIPCHLDFHHIYGYGNNTKEQYEEFI